MKDPMLHFALLFLFVGLAYWARVYMLRGAFRISCVCIGVELMILLSLCKIS